MKSERVVVCHTETPKQVNIFSKIIYCCHCGGTLKTVKTETSVALVCGIHHYDRERCPEGVRVTYRRLYDVVLKEFKEHIAKYANADNVSEGICMNDNTEKELLKEQEALKNANKKFKELVDANKALYIDKLKGVISEEMFIELSEEFSKDIEQQKILLSKIERRIDNLQEAIKTTRTKLETAKEYMNINELTFEIVHMFINKIIAHPTKKYSREVNVEIYWNF